MNARAIRADATYVLRAWMRGRTGVVVSLAMPLILLLGLGLIVRPGAPEIPDVHAVDLAQTPASEAFLVSLAASAAIHVTLLDVPPADLAAWMEAQGARGYVEVPPGFDGATPPRIVVDAASPATAAVVRDAVRAALSADAPLVAEEVRVPPPATYGAFLLPGVVGLAVLTVGLPLGFASVVELRQHGLMERLAVSPMTRREWLLARMLGASVVALASAVLLVLVAWIFLGVRPTLGLSTLLLVVAGTLVFSGLGALLGGAVRRSETGSAVLNLVLLPIVLLSGSFFDVGALPAPLRWLSLGSPLTHLNAGLRRGMLDADATGALLHAGALAFAAALLLLAGGRFVRWNVD
jgi:ABC-type multidrug transport system permease subunit